jgi:hypothetical protein
LGVSGAFFKEGGKGDGKDRRPFLFEQFTNKRRKGANTGTCLFPVGAGPRACFTDFQGVIKLCL